MNLDRLPILEVDGVAIGQSKAIERFVAAKVGLLGASPIEAAHIDM
jgi:glutathione S-transferase